MASPVLIDLRLLAAYTSPKEIVKMYLEGERYLTPSTQGIYCDTYRKNTSNSRVPLLKYISMIDIVDFSTFAFLKFSTVTIIDIICVAQLNYAASIFYVIVGACYYRYLNRSSAVRFKYIVI